MSRAPATTMQRSQTFNVALRLVICVLVVFAVVAALYMLHLSDRIFAAALNFFLLAVLVAAVGWGASYAVLLSFLAALGFSWLVPPVGHFHVADTRVWALLGACLVTGITASHMADRLRRAVLEANRGRAEAIAERQRFADLVNSVEGIVWEADAESFKFSFVSQQAERVLGYPTEKWLNEAGFWKEHLHSDDRDRAVQLCRDAIAGKHKHDFEYRMIAADGSLVWMRDLVTVVAEDGRPTRVRGVMVDITDRKRAEEERERLRQLESELAHINRVTTMGELTASLAHEINQPIAAAMTNANTCMRWLTRENPDIEEARAAAGRLVKDAQRAGEIIGRIRLLFKKGAPQRELVTVNGVINEIVALLRNEAVRHGVSIRSELAADLPQVMGDRVQLQQVLMNLMINSIDAMKAVNDKRELTLTSQCDGSDQLLVAVSDTGIGLPPEMGKIFDAFYTTKPHGTGMGLAISRAIIESHGGRMWATANSGRGATFYFTLPTSVEAGQ